MSSLLLTDPELELVATGCAIMIKFFVSINFYVSNLQAMETYPTCLRQTGISLGSIVANVFGMLGPYVVLLVSYASRKRRGKLLWRIIIYPYHILLPLAGNQLRCPVSVYDSSRILCRGQWPDAAFAWDFAPKIARDDPWSRKVRQKSTILVPAKASAQTLDGGREVRRKGLGLVGKVESTSVHVIGKRNI